MRSKLIKITIFFAMLVIPVFGRTLAYHDDREDVGENAFQSGTLEVELNEKNDKALEDLLSPTGYVERYFEVKNMGTLGFEYNLGAEDFGGDDGFCSDIQVEVYMDDSGDSIYEGSLKDFEVSTDEMYLGAGSDESEFKLRYYLPDLADSADSLSACEFDVVAKAWMVKYEYGKAYHDSSGVSQKLESGDWLIEMGYETEETLDDDSDGNPNLGFCGIETEDQTDGDTSYQVKWEKVEGTDKYILNTFIYEVDHWNSASSSEILSTDSSLFESPGVLSYEVNVSEEGLYAYYIQAFNDKGELIGSTTPKDNEFTCTLEIDWPEPEEEDLGILLENQLIDSTSEGGDGLDDKSGVLPGNIIEDLMISETFNEEPIPGGDEEIL